MVRLTGLFLGHGKFQGGDVSKAGLCVLPHLSLQSPTGLQVSLQNSSHMPTSLMLPASPLPGPAVVVPGHPTKALGGPCCPGDRAILNVALNCPSVAQWLLIIKSLPTTVACLHVSTNLHANSRDVQETETRPILVCGPKGDDSRDLFFSRLSQGLGGGAVTKEA